MRRLPLLLRTLRRRARNGPPARYDVRWEPAVPVPGADSDPLLTDHYAPVTTEPCPTVLIRAPYVRGGFPWNYLYGALVAEQGFHVLLQSSRGTGGSGGAFHPWHHEGVDGLATVEWLRGQEWFTGDFCTLGASYMAYAQAALAAAGSPPEWRGAVMQLGHTDPHEFFWGGGAFRLERALVGGLALFGGRVSAGDFLRGAIRLRLNLRRALREVPFLDAYPPLYGGRRQALEDWLAHPEPEFWRASDVREAAGAMDVPVSLCTGWWDLSPGHVIGQYRRLRDAGHEPDLLIGPWTHTGALEDGWAEIFGQALRRLRGEAPAYRVRVHVGGVDEWRDLPDWPPPDAREQRFAIGPPAAEHTGAPPAEVPPAGEQPAGAAPTGGTGPVRDLGLRGPATTFRYDPRDPTPSIGGALQSPTQGQVDNAALEKRADVLLFTGEPLTAPLTALGPVRAEVHATTTAAAGDLFVRLCDVDPAGRSINVCDGLSRIAPGGRTVVEMDQAGHVFRPGHRLRVQISGGAHPRWLRNYGTGEPPGPATRMTSTETTVRPGSALTLTLV